MVNAGWRKRKTGGGDGLRNDIATPTRRGARVGAGYKGRRGSNGRPVSEAERSCCANKNRAKESRGLHSQRKLHTEK